MVEARIQLATTERPLDGRFSFADTPRLTRALRDGDEAAFHFLHQQWNSRLFRYAFAIAAGDEALAGEIAQATYVRAFRHLRELPDETALWNWLARAARNAASDLRRTCGRYFNALARFADWLGSFGRTEPVTPGFDDETTLLAALDAAIAALDEPDRALLELRYFQPMPLAAIADAHQTTARAIEGRLARLRARLRNSIHAELKRHEHSQ